ncbi:MAG: type II secretion system minor pseudopilin GspH [Gammaproteobacteria bacterium]|nr:type II secretion system minor pseudopilin GspH [Gammaproteobacteria bacterium]
MRQAPRRRASGFTLIEILTVLVIIGIVVSMATLSLGNNAEGQVELEAERLRALIELAKEEALFDAQELGIAFWQNGYTFYRMEDQQWTPVEGDAELRPRTLPEGLSLSLELEGLEAELSAIDRQRKRPQVFIMSSGEVTPFRAELGTGETYVILKADALGNLAFAAPAI